MFANSSFKPTNFKPTRIRRAGSRAAALALALLLLSACAGESAHNWPFTLLATPAPAGSCTLALPADASPETAVRALLQAEGELVVAQQIDPLMLLWAEGASVTDAKNTPGDPQDDQHWLDKDAIRHRYVRTVFPGAPASALPADLQIEWDGDRAIVHATTQIGGEVAPAGDRWELLRRRGCWLLYSLTYNLEPAQRP